jgi:hypothetical protein
MHNDPYEGLCSKILVKPYIATVLINTLPHTLFSCVVILAKTRSER